MIIKLENITKSYEKSESHSGQIVLNDISFSVSKGDSISIIGPSGSGKSTLLNLMGTLDKPSSGKVLMHGEDVALLNANQLAEIRNKKVGFIFQSHHLLPQLSALENVLVPLMFEKDKSKKELASKRAIELMVMVGLHDKLNQFPGKLSVGECQRVAVVRALINEPEIILADEPTGSLDEASAKKMVDLLVEISDKQQVALVMVTHSNELAAKLKNIYKLSMGKLELVTK
jgi:ABC-type lipoprotein export system ATPase subunit